MRTIRIIFLILILVAVIYWLWTGDTQFLPYVIFDADSINPILAANAGY